MAVSKSACSVCHSAELSTHLDDLLLCHNCGMVTAKVDAGEQELLDLYGSAYFCGNEYIDYIGDKKVIQRNLRRWLSVVRSYVKQGALVEVGCAYGFFLELAQRHFEVRGYDVSPEAVEYASSVLGVPAVREDFLSDESLRPGSVDAVAMWDVVEHLSEPDRFVERSFEVLREGGYLFLTTGDIDSWLARRQGRRWRLIHPPTHLQYFSAGTIRRLLNGKGFDVVRVLHPGYWRTIRQILHGLFAFGRDRKPSNVCRMASRVLPPKMGLYVNTFDIMLVVARRGSPTPAASIDR